MDKKGLFRKTAVKKRYDWLRKILSSHPSGYSKRYVEDLKFGWSIFRLERKQLDVAGLDETFACQASFVSVPSYKLKLRPGS